MTEAASAVPGQWRQLSPWSIIHFAEKAIVENIKGLIYAGGPAALGASRWGSWAYAWTVPLVILLIVLVSATVTYLFYRYRILEDSVQVRRGALFKKHLNLSFHRMQNVSIEHPFYFRPLSRVTLRIDGAGAKDEEVNIAGLSLADAREARNFMVRQKHRLGASTPDAGTAAVDSADSPRTLETTEPAESAEGEWFFSRNLSDLIVHGLTNNRSFILIAAILGFLFQSGFSPDDLAARLGIDFDLMVAGLSLVRMVILVFVSLLASVGVIALLSVLVSVITYYGFTLYRTADSWTIKRGLLTRHEIHVRKSRIQTITLRQDWLDRLLGRRNVIFERISHAKGHNDALAEQQRRILVPSVRIEETAQLINELFPGCRLESFSFTPVDRRYFYKWAILTSLIYLTAVVVIAVVTEGFTWMLAGVTTAWPLHVLVIYRRWRCGGLAVSGDLIIARSGTIGIDYRLFAADKIQDITHVQSVLMRRRSLSSLQVHTAAILIRVPYMPTAFIRQVVDYCVFRAETAQRSWM